MDGVREFLETIDPVYRDEVRQILVEHKATNGPVWHCLIGECDHYAMAAYDRGLANAVVDLRPYFHHEMEMLG